MAPNISVLGESLRAATEEAKRIAEETPETDGSERLYRVESAYRKTRDFEWVAKQLANADPKTYLKRNHTLPTDLIRDGHGDWVIQRLGSNAPRVDDYEYGFLLDLLAEHGQAKWVVEHAKLLRKHPISAPEEQLLATLCREGYADFVARRIEEMRLADLRSKDKLALASALMRCGLVTQAVVLMEKPDFALEQNHEGALSVTLARYGRPELAIERLKRSGLSMTDEAGEIEFWHKELARALTPYAENPAVRAWLETVPNQDASPNETQSNPDQARYTGVEIARAKLSLAKQETEERDALEQDLNIAIGFLDESERKRLGALVTAWVSRLSGPELVFARLGMDATGVLTDAFARLVDFTVEKRRKFVFELSKTGSKLFIYGTRDIETGNMQITFVNDIAPGAGQTWQDANEAGIPVAPIIHEPVKRKNGVTRFYSRYCGRTIASYASDPYMPQEFRAWVTSEANRIRAATARQGLLHGHMHSYNFTVEFIRSDYLRRQTGIGATINQIPYDASNFSFDPIPYFENPTEWTPVVRLIDWDRASSEPPSSTQPGSQSR